MAAGPLVWAGLWLLGLPIQSGWPAARLWLMVVVLAPVLEEIVFRGGLQAWLYDNTPLRHVAFWGVSYANLCASAVFAAFHLLSQPAAWAAAIFIPALVFGWARDRSGSILPGMVLHAWYNAGFVLGFVR